MNNLTQHGYKNIFVTGAAGFIGSRTCDLLLNEGIHVVGMDNMNDYYAVELKKYRLNELRSHRNFNFIEGDIENRNVVEDIFTTYKPDAVINLAARAGVRASLEDPYIYNSTNTIGSLNVLECMKKYDIKKIVLASTSSLYAGEPMPFHEDLPVNNPISPYACSKKAAELLCYNHHFHYGIDVSIVRYFTVYGPAGRPDMGYLRFIKWIDEEQPIILFGDGLQSRDFTYIDDIAEGTIMALKNTGYEIINLGGGKNPISMNTVIGILEKYIGKKAIINKNPGNKSDMESTWADISKAKRLLNWEPAVGINEGLLKTVEWYFENKSWIKEISF